MQYLCVFVAFLLPLRVRPDETNVHDQIKGRNRRTTLQDKLDWMCWNPSDDKCNGSCLVHRDDICSQQRTCLNLNECEVKCDSHYLCQSSNKCVPRSTICDGNTCNGCEEDHGWRNGVGFKCLRDGRECVLPQQLLHDDISDCDGGIDLCFGLKFPLNETTRNERQTYDNLVRDKCFQCLNDVMLIPTSRLCDGVFDCDDLSDECLCEGNTKPEICSQVIKFGKKTNAIENDTAVKDPANATHETEESLSSSSGKWSSEDPRLQGNGPTKNSTTVQNSESRKRRNSPANCHTGAVECGLGICIPRSSVCNGVRDCENDERFDYCQGTIICGQAERYEEICRCGWVHPYCKVQYGISCNNVADCIHSSSPTSVTLMNFPEDECQASCLAQNTTYPSDILCDGLGVMDIGFDVRVCLLPTEYGDYENGADFSGSGFLTEQVSQGADFSGSGFDKERISQGVDFSGSGFLREQISQGADFSGSGFHPSRKRTTAISGDQHCDGFEDCELGDDEPEDDCPKQFRCEMDKPGYVSIKQEQTCDGILDCKDTSDETEELCGDRRFRCPSFGGKMNPQTEERQLEFLTVT